MYRSVTRIYRCGRKMPEKERHFFKARRHALAGIFAMMVAIDFAAAQSPVTIKPLSGPVHHVVYHGAQLGNFDNNLAVSVGADGILMIDHRNTLDNSILKTIEDRFGKSVTLAVNTHWHPDHTNGNRWFDDDVVVISHEKTRQRRATVQNNVWAPDGLAALPEGALPDITFSQQLTIYFNGEPIKLIALPTGHTDSDVLVLFVDSRVAVLGDVFNGRGQLSGYDWASGDPRNYLIELSQLIELIPDGFTMVTGHGGLTNKADMRVYHGLYTALIAELDKRHKAGMSEEEATEIGLPNNWLDWLPQHEYDDSGDWLLQMVQRLWADADTKNPNE